MSTPGTVKGLKVLIVDQDHEAGESLRRRIVDAAAPVIDQIRLMRTLGAAVSHLARGMRACEPFDLVIIGENPPAANDPESPDVFHRVGVLADDLPLAVVVPANGARPLDLPSWLRDRTTLLRVPVDPEEVVQLLEGAMQMREARRTRVTPTLPEGELLRRRSDDPVALKAELFDAIFASLADYIYVKDADSRLVYGSEQLARQRGHLSFEPMVGLTDREIFGDKFFEKTRDLEERAMRGENISEIAKSDPTRVELRLPLRSDGGTLLGCMGLGLSISTLGEMREKYDREQDLFDVLLETTPDKIYFKDLDSRFIKASLTHARQFGFDSADMMVGKSDADLFSEGHAQKALKDEKRIIASGEAMLNHQERIVLKDGSVRWSLTSKAPLRDRKGRIIGTFGVSKDITAQKQAEEELARTHAKLVETSRRAGMAEVATGVLHNVGNVLNSVNVSAAMVAQQLRTSRISHLPRVTELFRSHADDLHRFLTEDPQGQQLPAFIEKLSGHLAEEHAGYVDELESLRRNIEHIKDIVAMQQSYAQVAGVSELVSVVDLLEDALAINAAGLERHGVKVVRDYRAKPTACVDKHKVLQVLVNLISNAKYACDGLAGQRDGAVRVTLDQPAEDQVRVVVADNGVGISEANRRKLFTHGFTTKKDGHGFGLHNSAIAARELGGRLRGDSAGEGRGATFTFEFPTREVARA